MKTIWEIDKLLGLKKTGDYRYEGTLCTGEFEAMGDYGRGILYVIIQSNEDSSFCPMSISTIDDGVWTVNGVLKKENTEKLANEFIEKFGNVLPSEHVLNEFLRNYKLFGLYTG
jgi:hypothetical protein